MNIIYWDNIDHRWMYFEQALTEPSIRKFLSTILYCKEIMKADAGDNWNLGNPKYVNPEDLWALCKANGMNEYGNGISVKEGLIDLERNL